MGEIKNFHKEEHKKQEEEQVIEGIIGEYSEDWRKKLPAGINPNEVEIFLGNDGLYHWHLKPELIKDKEKRERYKAQREQWLGTSGDD